MLKPSFILLDIEYLLLKQRRIPTVIEQNSQYNNIVYFSVMQRHSAKCVWKHPPGDEIYRKDKLSVFEVILPRSGISSMLILNLLLICCILQSVPYHIRLSPIFNT